MKWINIKENNLKDKFKKYKDYLIILIFSATWCSPCKLLKRYILDNLLPENKKIVFMYIDIDDNNLLRDEFEINGVPSLYFYKIFCKNKKYKVEQLDKITGCNGDKLVKLIENYSE